jgi:multidrug efflux pump subunit AcrA (membrane-fusion protein)
VLVISANTWVVDASVDATSVGLIKTGEQAQLAVDGASGTLYGTIASIGLVSSSSSGTASYPVVIDVTGTQTGLHDGASVTATLIYKQLTNVVVVPALALHRSTNGTYVNKVVNGKTARTPVTVGLDSGGQVQITKGLAAGDKIAIQQTTAGTGTSRTGTGTSNRGTFPRGNFPGGGGNFPAGGGNFPGGFGGNNGGN